MTERKDFREKFKNQKFNLANGILMMAGCVYSLATHNQNMAMTMFTIGVFYLAIYTENRWPGLKDNNALNIVLAVFFALSSMTITIKGLNSQKDGERMGVTLFGMFLIVFALMWAEGTFRKIKEKSKKGT